MEEERARELTGDALPTRRDVLRLGAAGLITLVGFGSLLTGRVFAENRVLTQSTPALEEGPFWVEETDRRYRRSDLRANLDGAKKQPGLPLNLTVTVSQLKNGKVVPLPHAFVYLWMANAWGVYSGEAQQDTAEETFLRGYQVSDDRGRMQFLALYPGWYEGRTTHIHARVRTYLHNDPTQKVLTDFETQMFFDDLVTDHVMTTVFPYNQRRDRDTTNATDRVYNGAALDGTQSRRSGDLNKVQLTARTAHADATFHMVLDTTKHARPGIPPGGFGSGPPPQRFGGGPPPQRFGGPPPEGDWGPPPF